MAHNIHHNQQELIRQLDANPRSAGNSPIRRVMHSQGLERMPDLQTEFAPTIYFYRYIDFEQQNPFLGHRQYDESPRIANSSPRRGQQISVEDQPEVVFVRPKNPDNNAGINQQGPIEHLTAEDDIAYKGSAVGSRPNKQLLAHNFDFSGYAAVVDDVYNAYQKENSRISQHLPFAVFQHAMVEVLNAYLMHEQKFAYGDPKFEDIMNPLELIRANEMNIPQPIYDYICRIGKAKTPTGDIVCVNHPLPALWQGVLDEVVVQASPANYLYGTCSSGSFGIPTANNHNVYECYWSPYISRRLIEHTLMVNATAPETRFGNWNPFPIGWLAPPCKVNENLLGYHRPQRLNKDGIKTLMQCQFEDNNSITGLLAHSDFCIERTSKVLAHMRAVQTVKAIFDYKINSAAFIVLRQDEECHHRLANYNANKYSPFAFGSAASNIASFFAYKRERTEQAAGIFCQIASPSMKEEWLTHINDNFEMKGLFAPRNMMRSLLCLRDENHVENDPTTKTE